MYSKEIILDKNTGNNVFSYKKRKALLGKAQITIPSKKNITNLNQIKLGNHIVFEEIDHKGKINSCTGLKHIYHLKKMENKTGKVKKILNIYSYNNHNKFNNQKVCNISQDFIIMDNHNHALYFWIKYISCLTNINNITLLHIDQHSDLNLPPHIQITKKKSMQYIRKYTNYICNVGNFIPAFLHLYPQTNFIWIKSEYQLLSFYHGFTKYTILDIDLDFRAPEMSIKEYQKTIEITRKLIKKASFITIASSPYFLNQKKAFKILKDLIR